MPFRACLTAGWYSLKKIVAQQPMSMGLATLRAQLRLPTDQSEVHVMFTPITPSAPAPTMVLVTKIRQRLPLSSST